MDPFPGLHLKNEKGTYIHNFRALRTDDGLFLITSFQNNPLLPTASSHKLVTEYACSNAINTQAEALIQTHITGNEDYLPVFDSEHSIVSSALSTINYAGILTELIFREPALNLLSDSLLVASFKYTDGSLINSVLLKGGEVSADKVKVDTINEKTLDHGVNIDGVLCKDNGISVPGQIGANYNSGTADSCQMFINPTGGSVPNCYYIGRDNSGFGVQYGSGWYFGSKSQITDIIGSAYTWSVNLWDGTNPVRPSASTTRRFTVYGNGTGIQLGTGQKIDEFSTDGTFADDSDTALPTEKAVKTYVDTQVSTFASISTGTHNTTWSGIWADAQTGNVMWSKVGTAVTLHFPTIAPSSTIADTIHVDTVLPSTLRPTITVSLPTYVCDNGVAVMGRLSISFEGNMYFYVGYTGAYTGSGLSGFYATSVTYQTS